jgi:DNA transformation protein
MPNPKGSLLFVNVNPSEARRRLKGFGHGVRKIQSAGRNQAVIVHTATGRHLSELEAKFSDVGYSSTESDLSEPIENLRNLGPATGAWLREVGISTIAELQRHGPLLAYRLVRANQPQANWNLLWAMAAGLKDQDWRELTDEEKDRLRAAAEQD